MARALTSPELALLRSDGQWTKLYLAALNPNTIYTARLAALPSSNDNVHTITYNTGSGTLGDVKPGMTLYVGTTAGAHNLGICRIRKAPITGTWYIGLTSQITWQSNCYLTVVDDFILDAKHAVIDSGALKMDVDVAYSDQHASFNPVPVLGPHAVLWLTGATVSAEFDASDSWVFDSTISGYSWSAPGASATSGLTTATPTLTYNAAGMYRVLCTVTAANGKTTTGVRHVFVYSSASMPATVFQLAQCMADYETGGWMFDLSMEAEASLSEIRDRSLVVLFAEDWYGTLDDLTKQSIGPIEGRENIVCVGRIVGQSIRWDRESGMVHFTVQGLHHWLNKIKGFPIQLQPATVAGSWSEMPLMTVDRVLWHVLQWHSTVIETMDFYPSQQTRYAAEGMSMASSIWGQLADIAFSKILASPGVDRFGRLFVEVDPQMVSAGSRTWPTVMDLTDDDWQEGIDLQRVTVEDVSLIRLTTQNVNSSGSSLTLYSLSPGHTPRRYGDPELMDRVLAASQAESNSIAGLVLGWRINEFPDVPVVFLMNNRMFDLWPRQYAALTVSADDTPRGVSYDGNLIPRRISLYFDNEISYMHPEINFEGETFEQLSQNGDIPDVDEADMQFPPLPSLPELPDLPIIIPGTTEPTPEGPVKVLVHDNTYGLLFSENFNEASPSWITVNSGLTQAQYQGINKIVLAPNGGVYVAKRELHYSGHLENPFIAYAPYIGGTFTVIEDVASITAKHGAGTILFVVDVGINKLTGQAAYVIGSDGSNTKIYIGSGTSFSAGAVITSFTAGSGSRGSLTYGNGAWVLTGGNGGSTTGWWRLNSAASSILASGNTPVSTHYYHIRASSTDILYHFGDGGSTFRRSTGNCASFSGALGDGDPSTDYDTQIDCDPTGVSIMGRYTTGNKGKSSDSGATWTGLGSLPPGNHYFGYAGGAGASSRWVVGSAIIRYSPDFGTTWEEKGGNILTIAPIPILTIVKVVQQ